MRTIRVISLHQPWASAMAHELKRVETRHWPTPYRGPLAIHAAKTKEYLNYYFKTRWNPGGIGARIVEALREKGLSRIEDFPLGAIVGVTNQTGCDTTACFDDRISISPIERLFGNYDDGRYGWSTEGMERLLTPIPERGHQGFWNWMPPDDFELRYQDGLPVGKWVRK